MAAQHIQIAAVLALLAGLAAAGGLPIWVVPLSRWFGIGPGTIGFGFMRNEFFPPRSTDFLFGDGARPDVQAAFPMLPFASRAGWGYQLLTNMLPGGGNGIFRLHAFAEYFERKTTLLGSRTITVNNSTVAMPFGAIDTPGQGETVSGTITIWGWALTPQPANIPADGSTIDVVIDGVAVGHPTYGLNRADIAALFPGYTNTNSADGYFSFDTTTLSNGVHTLAWVVRDSMGRAQGIGSRYFHVQNF
jgi:hypothetical protein